MRREERLRRRGGRTRMPQRERVRRRLPVRERRVCRRMARVRRTRRLRRLERRVLVREERRERSSAFPPKRHLESVMRPRVRFARRRRHLSAVRTLEGRQLDSRFGRSAQKRFLGAN
ncbi:unnamed protein product [Oppiella nova]|uniref:Uncharacterized protein n=1 Tax=Oppiella nova TaxID=334625 RepID=A0A7R9MQM0_9ACAR|nr:unnamed protein product [Oppiella nova]CAG2181869.1 unnamed protein product [Oppiella nova]